MWDIFEFLFDLFHSLLGWRIYVGLAAGVVLCLIVMHLVPDDTLSWILGVPCAITGLVWGILWDRQSG